MEDREKISAEQADETGEGPDVEGHKLVDRADAERLSDEPDVEAHSFAVERPSTERPSTE